MAQDKVADENQETDEAVFSIYSLRLLVDGEGNCPFEKWFQSLRDVKAKARILARLARIANDGNPGDQRERIKGAVSELRIDYGPGYRIYFSKVGDVVYVLLGGGVKDTQQADIQSAFALWEANKDEDNRFSRVFGE